MADTLKLFEQYNRVAPVIHRVYRVQHRPGIEYAGHTNGEHYGLLYTLGGQGWMSFDGNEGTATNNTVFHGGAGCWHEYGAVGNSNWEIIIIAYDIPGGRIDNDIVGCHFESYQTPELRNQLIRLQTLEAVGGQVGETAGKADNTGQMAGAPAHGMVGETIRRLRANSLFYDILTQTLSNTMNERERTDRMLYDEASAYIKANCTQDLDIPSVARHFQVQTNRLYYVFRKFSSKSPFALICDCRFQHACELLRISEMPVAQVALQVGYADSFSFSKQFKNRYGVSPSHFRASEAFAPVAPR